MEFRHVSYSNFILYTETDQYIHADVMVSMRFRAMPSFDTFSNMSNVDMVFNPESVLHCLAHMEQRFWQQLLHECHICIHIYLHM